jgi:hypothetical protein
MRKKVQMLLGGVCYVLGLAAAIYIGGVLMVLHPISALYTAYRLGTLTVFSVIVNVIKILFSTTIAGLVWCIGYIGYNHFKGTEDPDWDEINARIDK